MAWIDAEDVNQRLASIKGKGWADEDLEVRISRAERFIKGKLLAAYGSSTVSDWDTTCPQSVKDICADLAALLLRSDFINDYTASKGEKDRTYALLNDLVKGKAELFDDSGNIIARGTKRVRTNAGTKTNVFQSGSTGDDTYGDKSLDNFGPDQESIEADLDQ